jgi:hypothetical protein
VTLSETEYAALYQQGFNEGYVLAQYVPEIADFFAEIDSAEPRLEGLRDGREEYVLEIEMIKEQEKTIEERDIDLDYDID